MSWYETKQQSDKKNIRDWHTDPPSKNRKKMTFCTDGEARLLNGNIATEWTPVNWTPAHCIGSIFESVKLQSAVWIILEMYAPRCQRGSQRLLENSDMK